MRNFLEGAKDIIKKQYKIKNNISFDEADSVVVVLDNPTLPEVKIAIDRIKEFPKCKIIFIFFDSQADSDNRDYGLNTAKILGMNDNILVSEFLFDNLDQERIASDIENIIFMTVNSGFPGLTTVFKRYIWANSKLKDLQRLVTIYGILNTPNATSIIGPEQYEAFPTSLLDLKLPKEIYSKINEFSKVQSHLWAKIANDHKYMFSHLEAVDSDDFVNRLMKLAKSVLSAPHRQSKRLIIARNDYLVNKDALKISQVEFNLMAAGLGIISERTREFHNLINKMSDNPVGEPKVLKTCSMFCNAFTKSFEAYGNPKAVIVFIIDKGSNTYSQEASIPSIENSGIHVRKYLFEDLIQLSSLDEDTGIYTVNKEEVAIFYFRYGYMPHHYNEKTWKLRENIEKSKAIKCPDVFTQLVNFKYFQYLVNKEETWNHFGYSKEVFKRNEESFCDMKVMKDFENNKDKMLGYIESKGGVSQFVMKPQREGGQNNYFGEDISALIKKESVEVLQSYILMERIFPTVDIGIYTDFKKISVNFIVSEIGLFNWTLSDHGEVLMDGCGDYLMRSKKNNVDEGGIHTGYAFLDTFSFEK